MSTYSTILVIDDHAPIRLLLKYFLHDQGYKIIEASNGKEGVEKARDFQPDLVITDFEMPLMNGIHVARSLRCHPQTREIPILLTSSYPFSEEIVSRFQELGIDAFLEKPFQFNQFEEILKELLSRNKAMIQTGT